MTTATTNKQQPTSNNPQPASKRQQPTRNNKQQTNFSSECPLHCLSLWCLSQRHLPIALVGFGSNRPCPPNRHPTGPEWWVAVFSWAWAFVPNLALLTSVLLLCRAGGGLRFIPAVQCKCRHQTLISDPLVGFLHEMSTFSFWLKRFWRVSCLPTWFTNQHQQHTYKQGQIWKLFSLCGFLLLAPSILTRKIKQWDNFWSDVYLESMHSKALSPLCALDARFVGQGMPVLWENGPRRNWFLEIWGGSLRLSYCLGCWHCNPYHVQAASSIF